jgi:protein ImuA
MITQKADIVSRLRRELLSLQRHEGIRKGSDVLKDLGVLNDSFPESNFPLAAVHEFLCNKKEEVAATNGFVSAIVGKLMKQKGVAVWIRSDNALFPPAFHLFGIDPDRIIFIQLQKEKELLWAMEEALKCNGLAVVVCELQELSFTSSRRFQLAVEQSSVTGFILRINPRNLVTTACVSRWQISSLASEATDLPGVGFPKWKVELLKIRNGKPGAWQVEWSAGKFHLHGEVEAVEFEQRKKVG